MLTERCSSTHSEHQEELDVPPVRRQFKFNAGQRLRSIEHIALILMLHRSNRRSRRRIGSGGNGCRRL